MKHTRLFITTCLCLFLASALSAQQGNLTAGGDATGSGGSLSYSVGQTDYLIYSSGQNSLSFGLQQPWHISANPPPTLDISDMVIASGESLCFNALETVTIAGDGDYFIVQANGHADIIAGHKILLRHGTSVELNGSLHARISDTWCPPQQSLLASFSEPIAPQPVFEQETYSTFFKVYPNPTTGNFTLELLEFVEYSNINVELYSALGHLVFAKQLPAFKLNKLNISDRQFGIYLIRVLKGQEIGTSKIIKQ